MSTKNPHGMATDRAYRRAVDWVREHHPDVWADIHRTERERLGLAPLTTQGPCPTSPAAAKNRPR